MTHFDLLDFVDQSKALGKGDIAVINSTLREEIALVNSKIRESELNLQKEIKAIEIKLIETEAKLIRWVVGTGITSMLAIVSLLKYVH